MDESTGMRRFALIFLALMVTTTACFGTTGSWRCVNGTPCEFTPGVGYHCPTVKAGSNPTHASAQPTGGACSHCRPQTESNKTAAKPGPCGSVCRGCHCEFQVISSRVPATAALTYSLQPFDFADYLVILIPTSVPTTAFATRPIIFTTGPPISIATALPLTTPSRAPPCLLCA